MTHKRKVERIGAIPMPQPLTREEQNILLDIAADAVYAAAHRQQPPRIDLASLPPALQQNGASFVTLTKYGQLRGCIGSLQAYQPLALDVQERAVQAAVEDPRFPPLRPEELPAIEIEVSRLTEPVPLHYDRPEDLPKALHPRVDGVILQDGFRRATFLPQVWDELPDPEEFLSHLCMKMGAHPDLWRRKMLNVQVYHVEEFKTKPEW
jgi:AmmeMemoRadiSam system protein A